MTKKDIVSKGDKVSVNYEGKLESGEIFDSSSHGDHNHPLEFTAGLGEMIKGFDEAVIGMKIGEEKEIKIAPNDAYGQPDSKLFREIPKSSLPQDQEPKEGMMLMMATPNGQQFPAIISKVGESNVTIDLNHPLAGKILIFKIKLESIS